MTGVMEVRERGKPGWKVQGGPGVSVALRLASEWVLDISDRFRVIRRVYGNGRTRLHMTPQ